MARYFMTFQLPHNGDGYQEAWDEVADAADAIEAAANARLVGSNHVTVEVDDVWDDGFAGLVASFHADEDDGSKDEAEVAVVSSIRPFQPTRVESARASY